MTEISPIQHAANQICSRYGADILDRYEFRGDITLTVGKEHIHEVIRWTRDALHFDLLLNVSSVDNMGTEPRFEVLYHLSQAETGINIAFKVKAAEGEAVPTVTDLFSSANWHEREVWDLMGISFDGHPDLRRIMMWEGYPYHPLRKDFPVEGVPTELDKVAFTETAPICGGPFVTTPCEGTAAQREPHARPDIHPLS